MDKVEERHILYSLEHHCYSAVPGKIDRKIYSCLVSHGVAKRTWVVEANLKALTKLHPGDAAYTKGCLSRLRGHRLILTVGKTPGGWVVLIPALKDFVLEPIEDATLERPFAGKKK